MNHAFPWMARHPRLSVAIGVLALVGSALVVWPLPYAWNGLGGALIGLAFLLRAARA